MFVEYIYLLKYFFICLLISILLISISYLIVYQEMDMEKISTYECGFNPFSDSRVKFEIRYYIVAILFLIFDLEITLLLPWTFIVLGDLSYLGGCAMFIFILLLLLGFIYEIIKGGLDWE